MGSPGRCVVCGLIVDWGVIREEFTDMLTQVDYHGPERTGSLRGYVLFTGMFRYTRLGGDLWIYLSKDS